MRLRAFKTVISLVCLAILIQRKAGADSPHHSLLLIDAAIIQNDTSVSRSDLHLGVATIKESSPESTGVHIGYEGRRFACSNATLLDLLRYVFKLNAREIESAVPWVSSTKYDIVATADDSEAMPSETQWLIIVKQLLAERFGLKFHYENRVAPVYILGVAHGGPKLTVSKSQSPLPDMRLRGLGTLSATNASMKDLSQQFQGVILDRPVVDHTNLSERYDFQLNWTVDPSQYDGRFADWARSQTPDPDRPSLTTALAEQLGLTLTVGRDEVPVFIIDQVSRPSAN